MKYLVLVGDGMADFALPELAGKTPLEAAATLAMDEVAASGQSALFCPIPDGQPPGSAVGNLSLFGYDPADTFTGRAPFEAANQGIVLAPGQLAFRCNLVTLQNGVMADFTAGHISSDEGAQLVQALNDELGGPEVAFHGGVGYRHLTIVTARGEAESQLVALECTPPHDITGEPYEAHLPRGPGAEPLLDLMARSRPILESHAINLAREKSGKAPATAIWLWGQGRAPAIDPYPKRFGIDGAVVSAVDLVNGIGRCAGLEVIPVEGATGYLDTNYAGKVSAALSALDRVDFVYLHVEAPDEASHEGKVDLKIQAIEDFDRQVVAPCLAGVRQRGDCRLLVAPDHVTALSTRTHASGPVPYALFGPGVLADDRTCYRETEAAKSGNLFPQGHLLVPHMIQSEEIRPYAAR